MAVVTGWQQETRKPRDCWNFPAVQVACAVSNRQKARLNAAESPNGSGVLNNDVGSQRRLFNLIHAAGRNLLRLLVLLVLTALAGLGTGTAQAQQNGLPSVVDIRVSTTDQRARLVLDLTGRTEFAIVSATEPNRIAVDVRALSLQFTEAPPVYGSGIVDNYTVEIAEEGRARAILTLAQPALVQQAYVLDELGDQPARLVVDFVLATAESFAAQAAADRAAAVAANPSIPLEGPAPQGGSRPLVVIDPGHGGIDNGASAPNGVHEKDIVLAYALDLQEALVASGRFDVALTRESDVFLRLEERVALARANKADLFISIHADAFQQPEVNGASIYTRDERATDVLDKVLADSENKVDIIAGFAMPELAPSVVDILVDLMRRQMRRQSFQAANAIVHHLEPSVALRRFPVRQADFFVLQAPDVPSVLLELGFLSNATDIANLQRSDWRERVVDALARGIASYFDDLETERTARR